MNTAGPGHTVRLEMGVTTKVFHDTLPSATRPYSLTETAPGNYHLLDGDRALDIQVQALDDRVIAGLSLPVSEVVIRFLSVNDDARARFMERFMRYFHRGGG